MAAKRTKYAAAVSSSPPGKLLLDECWLNDLHHWLDELARASERIFGQKPALEDLRQMLATVLGAGGLERWFSDGEGVELKSIVTKRVRRAPRAKSDPQKLKVGDVLAIPLRKAKYAFARVMHEKRNVGVLLEVWRKTTTRPLFDATIAASGRLLHPTFVNDLAITEGEHWKVVASDPGYRVSPADKNLEFSYPTPRAKWVARRPLDPHCPDRQVTPAQLGELERGSAQMPDDLEDAIREALKEVAT